METGQIVTPVSVPRAGQDRARTLGPVRPALRFPGPAAEHPHEPTSRPLLYVDEGARQRLEKRLQASFREPVLLSVTDNKRTMISSSRRAGSLRVRLHHMFLDADTFTVRAVAKYLSEEDRHASRVVGHYIEAHGGRIRPNVRKSTRLDTTGLYHDLRIIYDALNDEYFGRAMDAAITWGRALPQPQAARTSIKLGSYSQAERLIRIHRALDQDFVPRFMVEWIVYHEMLHHVLPMPARGGRRVHHTPLFRERELRFRHHGRAVRWQAENLNRLLGA